MLFCMCLQMGTNLKLLPARKKDNIRVVKADFKGQMGTVLNIADSDAIVKLNDGDMKVLDKSMVGLIYEPAQ